MDNIKSEDIMYILVKGLLYFGGISCLCYDGSYRSTSTASHAVSSQAAAGFTHTHTHTHTHVEPATMNKDIGQCIA